ncbi:MAG: hypothetical protein RhofKO_34030 [Rhodothermales bacterium]
MMPYDRWIRSAFACLGVLLLITGCTASKPTADLERLLGAAAWDATALPPPPALSAPILEQAIHAEVNRVRSDHGQGSLRWLPPLQTVSVEHSRHMAEAPFFGHTNPQGEDPSDRAARHGVVPVERIGRYALEGVGENLYLTHRYHEVRTFASGKHEADWKTLEHLATETVAAWMQSATHRANLLSPHYRGQGIGVVVGDNHTVYVTQNLSPCDVAMVAQAETE